MSVSRTTPASGEAADPSGGNPFGEPGICPECGAAWLADLVAALRETRVSLELLQAAILDRRLHLQQLPDGQFRVCERSFHRIREVP